MPSRDHIVAAGIPTVAAHGILGRTAKALTAAGTTQATALALPAEINVFATVGSGSGAIIPPSNPGDTGQVFNGGSNALLLYPPAGGVINALSANAGYSIAAATPLCDWVCIDALTYLATQGA